MKVLHFGLAFLLTAPLMAADTSSPPIEQKTEYGEEKPPVSTSLVATTPPIPIPPPPEPPIAKTADVPVSPMIQAFPSAITGAEPIEVITQARAPIPPNPFKQTSPVTASASFPPSPTTIPGGAMPAPAAMLPHAEPSAPVSTTAMTAPATEVSEPAITPAIEEAEAEIETAEKSMPAASPTPTPETPQRQPIISKPTPVKPEYGIETIDIESGGNWLIKRVIWEDGQRLYEKINSLLKDILESRISFFEVRSAADRALITFFVKSGFAQGELNDALQEMIDAVDRDRTQQGGVNEKEREVQTSAEDKKKKLEQLQTDVKAIGDFDAALDNALTEMMKQISRSMDYERQGWVRFKEIGQEIDDRKARVSYAHMEAAYRNLQAINNYLTGPFANYFTEASQKMVSLTKTIDSQVDDLKKDGLALKKQLTDVELAEQQAEKERTERAQREKEAAAKKAATKSWYSSFSFIWEYPIDWLSSFFNWIGSFFGSGSATIKAVSK